MLPVMGMEAAAPGFMPLEMHNLGSCEGEKKKPTNI